MQVERAVSHAFRADVVEVYSNYEGTHYRIKHIHYAFNIPRKEWNKPTDEFRQLRANRVSLCAKQFEELSEQPPALLNALKLYHDALINHIWTSTSANWKPVTPFSFFVDQRNSLRISQFRSKTDQAYANFHQGMDLLKSGKAPFDQISICIQENLALLDVERDSRYSACYLEWIDFKQLQDFQARQRVSSSIIPHAPQMAACQLEKESNLSGSFQMLQAHAFPSDIHKVHGVFVEASNSLRPAPNFRCDEIQSSHAVTPFVYNGPVFPLSKVTFPSQVNFSRHGVLQPIVVLVPIPQEPPASENSLITIEENFMGETIAITLLWDRCCINHSHRNYTSEGPNTNFNNAIGKIVACHIELSKLDIKARPQVVERIRKQFLETHLRLYQKFSHRRRSIEDIQNHFLALVAETKEKMKQGIL